jgi:hypothetical protein
MAALEGKMLEGFKAGPERQLWHQQWIVFQEWNGFSKFRIIIVAGPFACCGALARPESSAIVSRMV